MKNANKVKIKEIINKYKFYFILTVIIYILFFFANYSYYGKSYCIYINNNQVKLAEEIKQLDNNLYLHINDLTFAFKDNVYYDKISAKIIITTNEGMKKIHKDEAEYITLIQNDMYINIEKVMPIIGYDILKCNNDIYIFNFNSINAKVKNNRTELFKNNIVIDFLNKDQDVQIVVNELLLSRSSKVLNVINRCNNTYGTCLKENLQYEYMPDIQHKSQEKVIIVKIEDRINSELDTDNINTIAIDMLRLSGKNSIVELDYPNNWDKNLKVFATINNGQKSSNYDPDIISLMLNSDINRECVIDSILTFVTKNNLTGVNINFSNLKSSDIDLFTQYIKELVSVMHLHGKQVIVSVSNEQSINLKEISKAADYVIIQAYGQRTTASKTSGPISSVNYVDNKIKNIIQEGINVNKVIIEIPTYSILWTERSGTVINAELYNMSAMQEYIKLNGIEVNFDSSSNQNYFSYAKGITTYKMWLEDSHSVKAKAETISDYNLAGISIYKNGMELKNIYSIIAKIFQK